MTCLYSLWAKFIVPKPGVGVEQVFVCSGFAALVHVDEQLTPGHYHRSAA